MAPLLRTIAERALAVHARHAGLFSPEPPVLRLVSPLADGVDQWVAEIALKQGWRLSAALPFGRDEYRTDFAAGPGREGFDALLARAESVLELPGARDAAGEAYAMAGVATVAHADLLLAVWDGETARGRGGTAEVVECAWAHRVPTLHLDPSPDTPPRLLWPGFDPHCGPRFDHRCASQADADTLERVLGTLLEPPAAPAEARFLDIYQAERQHLLRARWEYPLLLALAGIKRFPRDGVRSRPYAEQAAAAWTPFRERCAAAFGLRADLKPLQDAYCWADGLAGHFAQSYRSGHVFNFMLGAAAVLLALTSLLWTDGKVLLAAGELVAVLAIIANTRLGTARAWHRRWLDYRQLAERLRPMRSLSLLGLARPPAHRGRDRWTDWVAAATWRALSLPSGRIAPWAQVDFARALAEAELLPQTQYNRSSARDSERLDRRLHLIGTALFVLTLIGTVLLIVGLGLFPSWVSRHADVFVWVSAGLPALGTAIWGIRVQGDFGGTAQRSLATASRLEPVRAELERGVPLLRAAALFEAASRIMVADLDEWRREHQKHELALP